MAPDIWIADTFGIDSDSINTITHKLIVLAIVLLVAFGVDLFCRKVVIRVIHRVTSATATRWDDYLLSDKILRNACSLIPPIIIYFFIPIVLEGCVTALSHVLKLLQIYIIVLIIRLLCSFLEGLYRAGSEEEGLRHHPLRGLYQMFKLIAIGIGVIIGISTLLDKNPITILTGLGASAAILMLVFKDTILGLVAGVQLSANSMLHDGDWITIPSRNVNGIVKEVTLTTVKVQNYDNTIVTVPPYALVSESFQNWRGMQQSGGRRVMRSLNIDMNTIRFCTPEEMERYEELGWLEGFTRTGHAEVNLHVFRNYVERYLASHPDVNTAMMIMIRQLQPTANGLPVELYFFTDGTEWKAYEYTQAAIFDHVIAMINEFGLKIFQSPTGDDITRSIYRQ